MINAKGIEIDRNSFKAETLINIKSLNNKNVIVRMKKIQDIVIQFSDSKGFQYILPAHCKLMVKEPSNEIVSTFGYKKKKKFKSESLNFHKKTLRDLIRPDTNIFIVQDLYGKEIEIKLEKEFCTDFYWPESPIDFIEGNLAIVQ